VSPTLRFEIKLQLYWLVLAMLTFGFVMALVAEMDLYRAALRLSGLALWLWLGPPQRTSP
jgi:hypothetical protein